MAKLATPSARIDKSTWGPGPWQDEPDLIQWRYLSYDCLAVLAAALRNWYFLGFDCGHAGDRSVGIEATLRHYRGQLDEQFDRATSETYRTLHYVKQQIRSLARQLYRMETADAP